MALFMNTDDHDRQSALHPFVEMWVTADAHIRQGLRADGRYDEARGSGSETSITFCDERHR